LKAIRIAHINIGGIERHLDWLIDLVTTFNIDILCLNETMQSSHDFWNHVSYLSGWKSIVVSRPKSPRLDGTYLRDVGGVAVINLRPNRLSVSTNHADKHGVLSVNVSHKYGSCAPLAIIAAYLNNSSSPDAHVNHHIINTIEKIVTSARPVYGDNIIIAADMNARLPTNRHTEDSKFNGNSKVASRLLARVKFSPLHGRSSSSPADTTSRAIAGRPGSAEVDFICAPNAWTPARYSTSSPIPWGAVPNSSTHRPIWVDIAPVHRPNGTPLHLPSAPRFAVPPYSDPSWGAAAIAITTALNSGPNMVTAQDGSATDIASMLSKSIEDSLASTLPRTRPHQQQHRNRTGNRGSSRSLLRKQLPSHVLLAIRLAHEARRAVSQTDADDRILARAEAKRLSKDAKNLLRQHRRTLRRSDHATLLSQRARDGRAFARSIQDNFCPNTVNVHDTGNVDIPSDPAHPPAVVRFNAHFRESFGQSKSDTPLPRGFKDEAAAEAWLRFLPKHPTFVELGRPYTSDEVRAIMGWSLSPLCPATGRISHDCKICADSARRSDAFGGPHDFVNEAPHPSMKVNTSASCNDTFSLAHIAHPHSRNAEETEAYRCSMSEALAALCSRSLQSGCFPQEHLVNRVIWLAKHPRGKNDVDQTLPKNYRAIFLAKVLPKIADLLNTNRLVHWLNIKSIVSSAHQGAYMPGLGGSWHLWALREALRDARRRNISCYAAFYDLIAAFDRIHPGVLRTLLVHAGMPQNLADYIYNTCTSRKAIVVVNGVLSQPIDCFIGSPQGGISSGIHLSIIVELVARYLYSFPDSIGLEFAGGRLVISEYADDLNTLTTSVTSLQQTIDRVNFCLSHLGFELNTGPGKTEVMAFLSGSDTRLGITRESLPVITVLKNGTRVPLKWVPSYKYLGYTLKEDLSDSVHASDIVATMDAAFNRVFGYNYTLRHLPTAVQIQLYKTYVLSSVAYLLPFVPVDIHTVKRIDECIAKFARRALNMRERFPTQAAIIMLGLPNAWQLLMGSRCRLLLSLALPLHHDAPAVLVFNAMLAQPTSRSLLNGPCQSWTHKTIALISFMISHGAPPIADATRYSMKSVSAAFARACGYIYTYITEHNSATNSILRCPNLYSPPFPCPPRQAAAGAMVNYGLPPSTLGLVGPATPLSAQHLLGLLTSPDSNSSAFIVASGYLGAALLVSNIGPGPWKLPKIIPDDQWSLFHYGHSCPFCPGTHHADLWHILVECISVSSVNLRPALYRSAASFLTRTFATAIARILPSVPPALRPEARLALQNAVASVPTFDWASSAGSLFLFRLLLAFPFPARAAPPDSVLLHHFGSLCDKILVRNTDLRQLASAWVSWSAAELRSFVSAWSFDVEQHLLPPGVVIL